MLILWVFGLVSCASKESLHIRQYHLRTTDPDPGGGDSIKAEVQMRLHGAVSEEERRERLGHYYTIRWDGPKGHESEPVRFVFRYRQAATGSTIHRREVEAPSGRKGKIEIQLTGSQYREGGRVLSWHLSFYRGDTLIETRQSYLWE